MIDLLTVASGCNKTALKATSAKTITRIRDMAVLVILMVFDEMMPFVKFSHFIYTCG